MVQNPQFLINIRKNINANNPGYGKYYPKAVEKETITLRGLAKHMSEHQCVYSRDIIEGVLIKMLSRPRRVSPGQLCWRVSGTQTPT